MACQARHRGSGERPLPLAGACFVMGPAAEKIQNVLPVLLSGLDTHRRGRLASCHVEPCGAVQAGPQGWGGPRGGNAGDVCFLGRRAAFPWKWNSVEEAPPPQTSGMLPP